MSELKFERYQHIEKWGHVATSGIEHGKCWIFPKIDGTNAQVWRGEIGLCAGSRNRELSIENDNAGFLAFAAADRRLVDFLALNPHLRLYGEWLVRHTLKTYREEAWRKFWIFDVYDHHLDRMLTFEEYEPILDEFGLDVVRPLCTILNPTEESVLREVEQNTYLIQEGQGVGEGVVVKNYAFVNRFGDQVWGKWVRGEFKEKAQKAFGVCEKTGAKMVEAELAEEFTTLELVQKTRAKIELVILNEMDFDFEAEGFEGERDLILSKSRGKIIPRLLETVFHEVVTEEIWSMLKKLKGSEQTIDFKRLRAQVYVRAKGFMGDLI